MVTFSFLPTHTLGFILPIQRSAYGFKINNSPPKDPEIRNISFHNFALWKKNDYDKKVFAFLNHQYEKIT